VARLKDSGTNVMVKRELLEILHDGGTDLNKIKAAM